MSRPVVKQNANGIWYARPYIGSNSVTKKPIRPYRQFPEAQNEAEAQAMADEWYESLTATGTPGAFLTLPQMLKIFVDRADGYRYAPSSIDAYTSIIRCYCDKYLADTPVGEIGSFELASFFSRMVKSGGVDGRPLSTNTVRKIHSFMASAFKWLRKNKFIASNPMLDVERPLKTPFEARPLHEDEYRRLHKTLDEILSCTDTGDHAKKMRMAAVGSISALRSGMRIGEVCGLQRDRIRTVAKEIVINQKAIETIHDGFTMGPPKKRSIRTIAADDTFLGTLRDYWIWLEDQGVRLSYDSFAVTLNGGPVRPSCLRHYFNEIKAAADLPDDVKFHTFRHTHATYLLQHGISIKDVAARLGHADEATTLRTYAHVMPGEDRRAADSFDETLRSIG